MSKMDRFIIEPLVGVGPVKLGMPRREVAPALGEPADSFRKTADAVFETDAFRDGSFQVFYGEGEIVEYIELSRSSALSVVYKNRDVFATPAEQLVTFIAAEASFDSSDPEVPYAYVFHDLQLSLWRPVVPASAGDVEGRYFSTIGIGRRGYYEKPV